MQAEDKMDIKKNTEGRGGKSKWYWETDRNIDNSKKMRSGKKCNCKCNCKSKINPKMLLSKDELGILEIDKKIEDLKKTINKTINNLINNKNK